MNTREVLINTILLQYRESERGVLNNTIPEWVLTTIRDSEGSGAVLSADPIKELKEIIRWTTDREQSEKIDKRELLSKVKLAVPEETVILEVLDDNMFEVDDPIEITTECVRITKKLAEYKKQVETIEVIKSASKDVMFSDKNPRHLAVELIDKLNGLVSGGDLEVEGHVATVSVSNVTALADAIRQGIEASSVDGALTTGWQGMNRMCGRPNGFRRGDFICFGALQHNYKSGTLLKLAKHFARYNKPYMIDANLKPLIVHISLENNVGDNTIQLFRDLRADEFPDEEVLVEDINPEEAATYVKERMEEMGYHFEMHREEPGAFNIQSFRTLLDNYRSNGYEIHAVVLDYMNLMGKHGCIGGNDATLIRDLFRQARSYTNPKMITLVTAHQLSGEAKFLIRQGIPNFVEEVAGKSYWDSCKSIDQELDLEVIQHIEKRGDKKYLAFAQGKFRSTDIVPEVDKYYAQLFHPVGAIRDDIDGEAEFIRKIPSATDSLDDTDDWWK